jgi:hypothetical protein
MRLSIMTATWREAATLVEKTRVGMRVWATYWQLMAQEVRGLRGPARKVADGRESAVSPP